MYFIIHYSVEEVLNQDFSITESKHKFLLRYQFAQVDRLSYDSSYLGMKYFL